MDDRLREVEATTATHRKALFGNGDPSTGISQQVGVLRGRSHDLANAVQAVDGRVLMAVKEREHELEKVRSRIASFEEDYMSKANVEELIQATVDRTVAAQGSQKTGRISAWAPYVASLVALALGIIAAVRS